MRTLAQLTTAERQELLERLYVREYEIVLSNAIGVEDEDEDEPLPDNLHRINSMILRAQGR